MASMARGAGLPLRRPRGSHLWTRSYTAFHFLISKRGGGGSSFFSSAAGPSLVSMADMGLPEVRAKLSATARCGDATADSAVQRCDGPSSFYCQRGLARRARGDPVLEALNQAKVSSKSMHRTPASRPRNWSRRWACHDEYSNLKNQLNIGFCVRQICAPRRITR